MSTAPATNHIILESGTLISTRSSAPSPFPLVAVFRMSDSFLVTARQPPLLPPYTLAKSESSTPSAPMNTATKAPPSSSMILVERNSKTQPLSNSIWRTTEDLPTLPSPPPTTLPLSIFRIFPTPSASRTQTRSNVSLDLTFRGNPAAKHLIICDYFVQQDDIGIINTAVDCKVHQLKIEDNGSLTFDKDIDFVKPFEKRSRGRPHSVVIVDVTNGEFKFNPY